MSLLEKVDSILEEMEKINGKLDRLLSSREFVFKNKTIDQKERIDILKIAKDVKKELPIIEKTIIKGGTTVPKKGQGRYEWFKVKGLEKVKVRQCSNEGCPYYLKYSEEKGKYEHWKYDPNTQEGGYVQDNCDHYFPEGL